MCGIVGFVGKKQAAPILLECLEKLEYRGYDSAGISLLSDSKITTHKTTGRIHKLNELTDCGKSLVGNIGIGHTRWATHGAPSDRNAHPHMSNDNKFSVVHNGIIENYIELTNKLKSQGIKFNSDTDTEVVAHLLSMYYTGDFLEAVHKTVSVLEGSFALGILCQDYPGKLICVRNSSPLIIGVGENENFIASDVTALISHTRDVIYLQDGEIAELSENEVVVFDSKLQKVNKEKSKIDWNIDAAEKGGYNHFMEKEIYEQPKAVKDTIEPRIKNGKIVFDDLSLSAKDLSKFNRIVITACGSASYAGQVGRYVLEELLRIPVEVDLASEFRYRNPVVDQNTLMLVISQSGETADTIAAMKEAKARGAHILAIVNVVGSTIAKLADDVLYTWAGPEIAVATTKGYTTQLALLYLIAIFMAEKTKRISDVQTSALLADVEKLPELMQKTLDMNQNIDQLSKKYNTNRSIFFIGRNIDYAVSLEGSLKLKEISYIHSEAYAAGELKHGTLSLIDEGRLVVALCSYEKLFDKLMSNIKEVKARGAKVLSVAQEGNTDIYTESSDVLLVPRINPLFAASLVVLPLQLFAYYIAKENNCDIDKPRNLAKSVTVE